MSSFSLTSTPRTSFSLYSKTINTGDNNKPCLLCLPALVVLPPPSLARSSASFSSSLTHRFTPLRNIVKSRRSRGFPSVCYAAPLTARNLQWISTVSSLVLMLARGTAVQKSFIVPLFALQAPASVIAWIKGRFGLWSAFLVLLVRLFFYIPGELELPFLALLMVIVAPYEALSLRETEGGAIISFLIAVYLAYQHFTRTGLQKAFDQGLDALLSY